MTSIATVLPAEWAPQDAILLTWPHAGGDWRCWLDQADRAFATLAAAISNGRPLLLDFRFNGWGGKYPCDLDDRITARLHALGAFGANPLERVELILESGSIETDGQGTLLTTARCPLHPNRNGLDRAALEQRLGKTLGITRFLWLRHGHLIGDDTDSHIDTLARFCNPRTIAYQGCVDASDPHFGPLQAMAEELRTFRTADGEPYRPIELPLPAARHDEEGKRLPAGYANFLMVNGAVLVPIYDDPRDAVALAQLQPCFPDREVLGISCATLIRQYGSLHCATLQLPAGVLGMDVEVVAVASSRMV